MIEAVHWNVLGIILHSCWVWLGPEFLKETTTHHGALLHSKMRFIYTAGPSPLGILLSLVALLWPHWNRESGTLFSPQPFKAEKLGMYNREHLSLSGNWLVPQNSIKIQWKWSVFSCKDLPFDLWDRHWPFLEQNPTWPGADQADQPRKQQFSAENFWHSCVPSA